MSEKSKSALTAMILSIVAFALCWEWATGWVGIVFSVAALVLSIIALNKIKPLKGMTENPGRVFVRVTSIVGLIALILAIISLILSVVCGVVMCSAEAMSSVDFSALS